MCAVAGVVELLVARPARCARAVEPAWWSGWVALTVDADGGCSQPKESITTADMPLLVIARWSVVLLLLDQIQHCHGTSLTLASSKGDCAIKNVDGELKFSCTEKAGDASCSDRIESLATELLALRKDMKTVLQHFGLTPPPSPPPHPPLSPPCPRFVSCKQYLDAGHNTSGPYPIYLGCSETSTSLYCDMRTDGGGWTYAARGTGNSNAAYGSIQNNPDVATQWGLGVDVINGLRSHELGFLEAYVTVGKGAATISSSYPAGTAHKDFRVLRFTADLTFDSPFDQTYGLQVWSGNAWVGMDKDCRPEDRGPCWEPTITNYCCSRDTSGSWTGCKLATVNLEGQWSNVNTNQHLRCSEPDYSRNGLVLFVR